MPFIGTLEYEKIKDKESFVGRPVYRLTAPFGYFNDKVKRDFTLTCHEGFKTDFASIPEWFRMNPRGTLWAKGTVIHDLACQMAKDGQLTYKEADAYLFYALTDLGAAYGTAMIFWCICRLNHIVKQFLRL